MELATTTYDFLLTLFLAGVSTIVFGLVYACLFVATNVPALAAALATFCAAGALAAGVWCLCRESGRSKGWTTGLGLALLAIAACLGILLTMYAAGSALMFFW